MTLDADTIVGVGGSGRFRNREREDTVEGYATKTADGRDVLHYRKKDFTKKEVLNSAFKGKGKLTRSWWDLKSTKTEYQLVFNKRLHEAGKPGHRELTPAEQKKFGIYRRETMDTPENHAFNQMFGGFM